MKNIQKEIAKKSRKEKEPRGKMRKKGPNAGTLRAPVGTKGRPRVYTKLVEYGLGWADNLCNIETDVNFRSSFCQITNYGELSVNVRLNQSANAVFTLAGGDQKTFEKLNIGQVAFMNADSGNDGEDPILLEVIFGF